MTFKEKLKYCMAPIAKYYVQKQLLRFEYSLQPYEDKLKELKKLTKDLWERVKEKEERPRYNFLPMLLDYKSPMILLALKV